MNLARCMWSDHFMHNANEFEVCRAANNTRDVIIQRPESDADGQCWAARLIRTQGESCDTLSWLRID